MSAPADEGGPERILLVGMMGAGKTTVGARLAARLGWRYLDSDAEILARTGRSVPEIWHQSGEAAFRREEAAVLADAVTSPDPVVVSVAGGAVLDPANRRAIEGAGLVVWLRADPATLAARVGAGEGRPLLEDDPAGALRRLDAVRRPVYESLADAAVDVDGAGPDEVVDAVLAVRTELAAR